MKLAFALPHKIAYEPYVKAFQYKILNSILYTNKKLFKIGYSEHDKCTFCDNESETLDHLFFLLLCLEYILDTFWKILFYVNKKIKSSQHSRYYIRHYSFTLLLTELFDING